MGSALENMATMDLITVIVIILFCLGITLLSHKYRQWPLTMSSVILGIFALVGIGTQTAINLTENGTIVDSFSVWPMFVLIVLFLNVLFPIYLLAQMRGML